MFPLLGRGAGGGVALAHRAKELAKRLRGPRPTDHLLEARYWYPDHQLAHTWSDILDMGAAQRHMCVNMLRAGMWSAE